jgi:hypothetical protein
MPKGKDTRYNPNRKVSKSKEAELRDKAWLKWQVEGPRGGDINAHVEAHYQTLLNAYLGENGQ